MSILPRPVSPRSAFGDLWSYVSRRHPHRWPLLGVSVAITWVIIQVFMIDANTNTTLKQDQIIYFENWTENGRSDAAIIQKQKDDLADYVTRLHAKQREMQRLADRLGIDWREDAKRNSAKEAAALKYLNAQLDKRLAEAEAKEGPNALRENGQVRPIDTLPVSDGGK